MPFLHLYRRRELPLGLRHLSLGQNGRDVQALQRRLAAVGFRIEADGEYGLMTEEAVRRLQARSGLSRDGIAGPRTLSALATLETGRGLSTHRVRSGETLADIAEKLGVTREALARQNHLRRRNSPAPGTLLTVSRRLLLLAPEEKPPEGLVFSAQLGPLISLSDPAAAELNQGTIPVLTGTNDEWRQILRRPHRWKEQAENIRRCLRDSQSPGWAVVLPPMVRRRRLTSLLTILTRRIGVKPELIAAWPQKKEPPLNLFLLSRLGRYLLIDPGDYLYTLGNLARLIRHISIAVSVERLLLIIRPGMLMYRPRGKTSEWLSLREARIRLAETRVKTSWHETDRIYRGRCDREDEIWECSLLDERGTKDRVRLADRFGLAGVVLAGLDGLRPPQKEFWPGEFSVLDNFPQSGHIN